jgi:hypothetical protein
VASNNDDSYMPANPRRGTALLVITIVIVATGAFLFIAPGGFGAGERPVRVAVVDSGMTANGFLQWKIAAEKSFVASEYGYSSTDNATGDSAPHGILHGSYVARIIVQDAPNVLIVNAKVVDSTNAALEPAIAAAIHWAVDEQDCDVVNLSLGRTASSQDVLRDVVRWAFERGVTVVAAAGNNGQDGVSGSSIESPAAYPQVIAVGAVNEKRTPYAFSGRGPLRNGSAKPDISADGWYTDQKTSLTVLGTSFAAPRVTAAAVNVISHCRNNGWEWTPGMVKAALIASAQHLSSDSWEVGAGYLDVQSALNYLDAVPKSGNLPLAACVLPSGRPYSFERWFVNTTGIAAFSMFASTNAAFDLFYEGSASPWIGGPQTVLVNQTGSFSLRIRVISGSSMHNLRTVITLIAPGYHSVRAQLRFNATVGLALVAFDTSHSPWWTDSIFGQFRDFYRLLTQLGIAVEAITDPESLELDLMLRYDAIVVLDPCAWDYVSTDGNPTKNRSASYSQQEIDSYVAYWKAGRGLLVAGLQNSNIDVGSANQLLAPFNVTMNYDSIPPITIVVNGVASTVEVTNLVPHNVTKDIESFDFNGCSLNYSGTCFPLAWTQVSWKDAKGVEHVSEKTVLAGLEAYTGSRMIVVGSNYLFDNWGISGLYRSNQNSKLGVQMILWLTGLTWP